MGTNPTPPPPHQKPTHPKNDVVFSPILQPYNQTRDSRRRANSPPPFTLTTVLSAAISWLRNRRIRFIFLLLCSPLLFIFLFIAFPFLCITEICLRRRLWRKLLRGFSGDDSDDRLRRCEEGCCHDDEEEDKGLLHRYLEDQLFLVRSMYECGGDEEELVEDEDEDEEDSRSGGNLGSCKTPLLLR